MVQERSQMEDPAARTETARTDKHRRVVFRTVLAVALAASVSFAAVDRLGGSLPHGLAAFAQPFGVVANANADQNSAIQGVIQRANAEQAQAIAARDPSAMADTSTSAHYRELQQINQDLLSNGVTSIALAKLEWGPVTVNGTTATATTYETWSTTYTDGSTEQSRDQNEYTLVQQQDGSWRIQSNDHPDSAGDQPAVSTAPSAPTSPSAPGGSRQPRSLNTSNNWSGYAATGGAYTAVSGTWTVPEFSSQSNSGMDASWVGIGGVSSRDLIQAGTQEMTSGNGQTQYQAWIELLPRASTPVPLAVHAGDSISVSINEQSTNNWQISFKNNTTGQTLQRNVQYASSHSSAEWIEEAPSSARGGVLPLDSFGSIAFSNGSAVKDGQTVSIGGAGAQAITMIGANRQPLATTSALGGDGSSFTVSSTPAVAAQAQSSIGQRGTGGRRSFGS
jgi:ketosteroid isomerase-like protein